jgi:hypothetical protein
MKTLHIVMILNFVVLATWGGWVYQTATQHQYQCTTDTECEEEELLIKEGKQS